MPRLASTITLLAALAPLGVDPALAADSLQARGDAGLLVLTQSPASAVVRRVGGGSDALPLPTGALMHSLQATGAGWTAAGTEPVTGGDARLLIFTKDSTGTRALPSPATAGAVREPVLVGTGGQLRGLAWIEGNDVRAAAITGGAWAAPRTLAHAGSGTTVGLAASVLADGSWLVLWSAHDGQDDEIYWAARAGGGEWTPPARVAVDNAVPDITPAVRRMPGGALAAWSRFDGTEYELVASKFDGTAWAVPARIAGAGALRPSFPDLPGAPLLLYRTARPRGWALLEARGRFPEITRSNDERGERPVVESTAAGARLRWDDEGSAQEN